MKEHLHKEFMEQAIAKAMEGIQKGQTPFGACIVRDKEIISCAHNQVWQDNDITAHAEVIAIRKACRKLKTIDLSQSILYSTCEPCPMCFAASHWARISMIVHGADINDAIEIGFNELRISNTALKKAGKIKLKLIRGILRGDNLKLFKLWQKQNSLRKGLY